MASQLVPARAEVFQECDEPFHADPLVVGKALVILAVEVAAISNSLAEVAHRDPDDAGGFKHDGSCGLVAVSVLVRVNVGGIAPGEVAEHTELAAEFGGDGNGVILGDDLIQARPLPATADPLPDVEVEADTQS